MIKLNLLPAHIFEAQRIKMTIIIFVVLLVLEGGVMFKAYIDLQAQAKWFDADKQYFVDRKAEIEKAKQAAQDMKGISTKYDSYITFFTGNEVKKNNQNIVNVLKEVSTKLGGTRVWYDSISVDNTGAFEANGKIKGLMEFVNLYFKTKASGITLVAAATVAGGMNQEVPVKMTGKLSSPPWAEVKGPEATPSSGMFQPAGAGGGTPAEGGAPGAPGGPGMGAPPSSPPPSAPPPPTGPQPSGPAPTGAPPGENVPSPYNP